MSGNLMRPRIDTAPGERSRPAAGRVVIRRRLRAQGLLLALAAAITVVLSVPASAQAPADTVQTENAIALGDAASRDGAIRERIQRVLGEIDGYGGVQVAVAEGVVTLTGTVLDNTSQQELTRIADRVEGVVAIENDTDVSGSLEERLAPAAERLAGRVQNVLANAPIFLVALLTFVAISLGGWILTTRIGLWSRIAPNEFIANVYRAVARVAFIMLGVIVGLDILNATALIGAVLGAAGVVGLAVGFAVRDTVENFIASILLSLRQPFRPNDFVDIQGDMGTVSRLTSRATILISPEGNHIRVPNSIVFKGRIVNFTRDPQRRFDFRLGVDADADLASAMATAIAAVESLPYVLRDPAPSAWVEEVGDSNVVLFFAGWVDQTKTSFPKARGEAIRTAKTALETAGFGLPEPIYRVRLDSPGEALAPGAGSGRSPTPDRAPGPPPQPPSASDPARPEAATRDAALRDRMSVESEENLLDPAQKTE